MKGDLFELVERRAEHEALKSAIMAHGRCVTACACWHDEPYGARRLSERLSHMAMLADRLEATLGEIQRIEAAVFSR